jgi:hypothetical protein
VGFATNLFFCPSDPFRTGENNLRTYAANGGDEAENYQLPLLPPFGNYGAPPGRKPMRMSDLDMNKGDIILIGERPGDSTLNRGKVGQFAFCGLGQTTTGMHDKGRRANYLWPVCRFNAIPPVLLEYKPAPTITGRYTRINRVFVAPSSDTPKAGRRSAFAQPLSEQPPLPSGKGEDGGEGWSYA